MCVCVCSNVPHLVILLLSSLSIYMHPPHPHLFNRLLTSSCRLRIWSHSYAANLASTLLLQIQTQRHTQQQTRIKASRETGVLCVHTAIVIYIQAAAYPCLISNDVDARLIILLILLLACVHLLSVLLAVLDVERVQRLALTRVHLDIHIEEHQR